MKRRDFLSLSSLLLLGFGTNAYASKALYTPQFLRVPNINNGIPNSPLPLVLYRDVIPANIADKAGYLESIFANNSWQPAWRYQIFTYHHFHSSAHECVACYRGSAKLQIGGVGGDILSVGIGDVLIIPAGVGHKQVEASSDFNMVGAYPIGQRADVCRDDVANLKAAMANIAQVPLPRTDPLNATHGGLIGAWR